MLLVAVPALLVALKSRLDRPAPEIAIDTEASVAAAAEPVEPEFESEPAVDPGIVVSRRLTVIGVPALPVTPPEPTTVIILPARVESSDPVAAAVTDAVQQSTLRALRAMPGINVVELSTFELSAIVPPNAGPVGEDNVAYLAIARRHKGHVVAQIFEQTPADSPFWSLSVHVRRPNGNGRNGGIVGKNNDTRYGRGNAETVGVDFAERIASDAHRVAGDSSPENSSSPMAAVARSVLLDPTRSETSRLRSLSQLLNGPDNDAAIAAAVEMATRSASAETRQMVWALLRRSAYDPALAQPLSYSLLSDVDAAVRKEAALALAPYLGDPAASAALEHASRSDSSPEVRLAARMATMDYDEQQAFRHETLLDRNLTPAERLAPTIVDSNSSRSLILASRVPDTSAQEEMLALAEIVAAVDGADLKLRVLSELQIRMFAIATPLGFRSGADDATIVAALVDTSRHADERVRRQALGVLGRMTQRSGSAEGRAVLESVIENEPELAAELNLAGMLQNVLQRPPPNTPPR
jgi:hypothetical protein